MILRKRNFRTAVPFLPEEIITKILLLLPAKVLHDVMRTICRSWRKVIRDPVFINAHRSYSTTSPFCLIIECSCFKLYSLKKDKITWKFYKTVNQIYLSHGDGFILTANRDACSFLYLVNPLTKQTISLPRLEILSWPHSMKFAVSCTPITFKYKVVVYGLKKLYILTVGDDKEWREIELSQETSSRLCINISHQGFIYLYYANPTFDTYNYLIAFDVENEVFHEAIFPKEVSLDEWEMCSGASLVLNYRFGGIPREFWELEYCRNGGLWRKLGIVDFESKKQEIIEIVGANSRLAICAHNMKPVVVLSRDVVMFNFDQKLLAYNFKTGNFSRCFDYFCPLFAEWRLMIDNNLVVLQCS